MQKPKTTKKVKRKAAIARSGVLSTLITPKSKYKVGFKFEADGKKYKIAQRNVKPSDGELEYSCGASDGSTTWFSESKIDKMTSLEGQLPLPYSDPKYTLHQEFMFKGMKYIIEVMERSKGVWSYACADEKGEEDWFDEDRVTQMMAEPDSPVKDDALYEIGHEFRNGKIKYKIISKKRMPFGPNGRSWDYWCRSGSGYESWLSQTYIKTLEEQKEHFSEISYELSTELAEIPVEPLPGGRPKVNKPKYEIGYTFKCPHGDNEVWTVISSRSMGVNCASQVAQTWGLYEYHCEGASNKTRRWIGELLMDKMIPVDRPAPKDRPKPKYKEGDKFKFEDRVWIIDSAPDYRDETWNYYCKDMDGSVPVFRYFREGILAQMTLGENKSEGSVCRIRRVAPKYKVGYKFKFDGSVWVITDITRLYYKGIVARRIITASEYKYFAESELDACPAEKYEPKYKKGFQFKFVGPSSNIHCCGHVVGEIYTIVAVGTDENGNFMRGYYRVAGKFETGYRDDDWMREDTIDIEVAKKGFNHCATRLFTQKQVDEGKPVEKEPKNFVYPTPKYKEGDKFTTRDAGEWIITDVSLIYEPIQYECVNIQSGQAWWNEEEIDAAKADEKRQVCKSVEPKYKIGNDVQCYDDEVLTIRDVRLVPENGCWEYLLSENCCGENEWVFENDIELIEQEIKKIAQERKSPKYPIGHKFAVGNRIWKILNTPPPSCTVIPYYWCRDEIENENRSFAEAEITSADKEPPAKKPKYDKAFRFVKDNVTWEILRVIQTCTTDILHSDVVYRCIDMFSHERDFLESDIENKPKYPNGHKFIKDTLSWEVQDNSAAPIYHCYLEGYEIDNDPPEDFTEAVIDACGMPKKEVDVAPVDDIEITLKIPKDVVDYFKEREKATGKRWIDIMVNALSVESVVPTKPDEPEEPENKPKPLPVKDIENYLL